MGKKCGTGFLSTAVSVSFCAGRQIGRDARIGCELARHIETGDARPHGIGRLDEDVMLLGQRDEIGARDFVREHMREAIRAAFDRLARRPFGLRMHCRHLPVFMRRLDHRADFVARERRQAPAAVIFGQVLDEDLDVVRAFRHARIDEGLGVRGAVQRGYVEARWQGLYRRAAFDRHTHAGRPGIGFVGSGERLPLRLPFRLNRG